MTFPCCSCVKAERKTRTLHIRCIIGTLIATAVVFSSPARAQRASVSLNGQWEIAETRKADVPPTVYTHTVQVPGLVHSATPAFKDVDQFQSKELLSNLVGKGRYDRSKYLEIGNAAGVSVQQRSYFWYHRTFYSSEHRSVSILRIGKAQFGVAVYLNGHKIGEHFPCFTAAYFDLTKWIRWNGTNDLTIRVGAHPGVLPTYVSAGTDFEKNRWTPGIYDDVAVIAFDGAGITNVQAAPRIESSELLVETELHNFSRNPEHTVLRQTVKEWKSGRIVQASNETPLILAAGEVRRVRQTLDVPSQHLWTPEDPFLYEVETQTSGDSTTTRFGMREFHFDTVTQRAYLNGRPYFLRGSNIALHRFFEDPESGTLPWNEAWLQKLLVQIPKQMNWNTFRFSIGPVPDRWLQIADEAGLLVQNEYMVWVGHQEPDSLYQPSYDAAEMSLEFREWMRDNWNHPSVVIWNASNESWVPILGERVIPQVRDLDLSSRPWDNGYYPPQRGDDPMDDHPYLFVGTASGKWQFRMTDLEAMQGLAVDSRTTQTGHALVLNEYGWLWLNRDGSPTILTEKLYPLLLGHNGTAEERFAMQAYLLAGETEFWRTHRRYAGVLHFVYLTASEQDAFTADHFLDVKSLTLEPHFADYMGQAFKPLGVYINFWHTDLVPDSEKTFTVLMVNDTALEQAGKLQLQFIDEHNGTTKSVEKGFRVQALGADSFEMSVRTPSAPGRYTLVAKAATDSTADPTVSRRWVVVKPQFAGASSSP